LTNFLGINEEERIPLTFFI